jgi:hypothetical protein
MGLTGRCRCGGVEFTIDIEALPAAYACHCLICQTWSGSAFALHALLPASLIDIRGDMSEYAYAGEAGTMSRHWSCSTCATRIANENEAVPGMIILRAGTLDRSGELLPAVHIWTSRKQPWLRIDPGVAAFEKSPTPEEFGAALAEFFRGASE